MLPTRFIPSLLFLCSFSLASSPVPPLSFSPPSTRDPAVDFVAIATAFSPAPALISLSTPQTASISAIDPSSPAPLPSVAAPVKSAQALAQHERELVEKRLSDLDRMVEDPKFLVETEEAYTLKADCKVFIRDFGQLIKIGSQGYSKIMQHQDEINAVTSKASALVISLVSMNVAGAAAAISQLLPDVANLVRAVAPDLLEMIKAAAPVAAKLLKSVVRIPANTIRKIRHKVRSYLCDAGGNSSDNNKNQRKKKKKLSERRLKKCIARGYFPKGYNPDKDYDLTSVNEESAQAVTPSVGESQKPVLEGDGQMENPRSAETPENSEKKAKIVTPVKGQITHDPFNHPSRRPRTKVVVPSTDSSPASPVVDPVVTVKEAAPSQSSNTLPVKEEVPASDIQVNKIDMEK